MTSNEQSSSLKESGSTTESTVQPKKVAIIGLGYVGLVTGATFAKKGLEVLCVDIIPEKIEMLNRGEVPFYEPALDSMVTELVQAGKLKGTTDLGSAIKESEVSFICVGTPQGVTGFTDLGAVRATAQSIGEALGDHDHYHVVVTKSTVPPGTGLGIVLPILQEHSGKICGDDFGLCSNPEFLREGSAVKDSLEPDRIVIGGYDKRCCEVLYGLYDGFACPILRTDIPTAETVKYAANAFLATKISFINELAKICEEAGVDVYKVKEGMGLDHRISPKFLRAGLGFGGSCFPKDVLALVALAKQKRVKTPILKSVLRVNADQPQHAVELLTKKFGSLRRRRVTVLGLSFKPNTDDVRETRALPLIEGLLTRGADVIVYCPKGMGNFQKLIEEKLPIYECARILYATSVKKALKGSEACIIQNEWDEFRELQPEDFTKTMRRPVVLDGRRILDPEKMKAGGVQYLGIGWGENFQE